jgi:hypothetical protein
MRVFVGSVITTSPLPGTAMYEMHPSHRHPALTPSAHTHALGGFMPNPLSPSTDAYSSG